MELKNLPELLSPAGSPDALYAAIDAGADAVYLGAKGFNARMNAANFTDADLSLGIARAHRFGVKVYATLNTLVHDREIPAFLDTARALFDAGIDGAIVADLGAMALLSRALPTLPLHASTQASVHSLDGLRAMVALGASRVVPARELSLENIRTLTERGEAEVEVFVHGALCVSYSGQCLFSSLVGGRSGNRGECAQPCRLPYNGGYPLSLRDLSLASHIPALIDLGVSSLKIEGRMKSAAYVYGVTSIYRRLLDERRSARADEIAHLSSLFSRDGFTDGYFVGRTAHGMTGTRSAAAKEATRALPPPPPFSRKIPLSASLTVLAGQRATLTLSLPNGKSVTAQGDIPAPAKNAPLTEDALRARIAKLGGTDYTLAEGACKITLDNGLFLTPAAINALRRAATEALDQQQNAPVRRRRTAPPEIASPQASVASAMPGVSLAPNASAIPAAPADRASKAPPRRIAVCREEGQARAATDAGIELVFLSLDAYLAAKKPPAGVALPPVIHDHERACVFERVKEARARGAAVALCTNIGQILPVLALGLRVVCDLRLNVYNKESAAVLREMGAELILPSPELSLPQLRDLGLSVATVYGRLPLMLTERCFIRENFGCDSCSKTAFTDRRGARFPILREQGHRNLIVNSRPTYMGDRKEALAQAGIACEHFLFTNESERECRELLSLYEKGLPFPAECRRIGRS